MRKKMTMNNEENAEDAEYEYEQEDDAELQADEQIDQEELDNLAKEEKEDTNPTQHHNEEPADGINDRDTVIVSEPEDEESNASEPRRSGRTTRPVERLQPRIGGQSYLNQKTIKGQSYFQKKVTFKSDVIKQLEYCHNLITQTKPTKNEYREYNPESEGMLMARLITDISNRVTTVGASFAQQYLLKKGLKVFGQQGHQASYKEIDQLHRRSCFTPVSIKEMSSAERKKAQQALMFLTEKRDGSVKGRMVYNGKPTREWLSREDAASPTAALESIMLTAVIDAKEERNIMTCDIPNAFIQAEMPEIKNGEERVMMKITGVLVDMLIEINSALYSPYVVYENGKKVLYVLVLRAIYGMLEAALLWYKKFRKELEGQGFKFNPYDPCVANRMKEGSQHTILFHVDDLKSSHKSSKVNDKFEQWLQKQYGKHGKVASHRGKIHEYLGMELDYSVKGEVKFGMTKYVRNMLETFPVQLNEKQTARTPAGDNLFDEGRGKKLNKERAEAFHTTVAKGLFLCKRARPDIQQPISLLCTRVKDPNESDWNKLVRMMKYLNGTRDKRLTLKADSLKVIKWYVDASFAVHPDFKSHTGGTMTFGKGAVQSISRKHKLNTRSSTEAELVGVDDVSVMILWTKLFMEEQGYNVKKNILYQDNKSAILLETNGRRSAGKRSRALNIRYFFITDQVEKGNVTIEHCPSDEMIGDFHTKPLQGAKFLKFRDVILGN